MSDNQHSQEERDAFKAEFEHPAIIAQSIAAALAQHHEIYLADDKFVMKFTDFNDEENGLDNLKENTESFTTDITLKRYTNDRSELEISIPNNQALFIRIPAKFFSAAVNDFKKLGDEKKKVTLDLRFRDQESIQLSSEFYFSFEDHIND